MMVNAVSVSVTVAFAVSALLADAGVDAHNIDEIFYGWNYLFTRSRHRYLFKLQVQGGNRNTFFTWDGCGGGIGDLTTIFIRESAFQLEAALNSSISDSEVLLRKAFSRETKMNELKATTRIR